MAERTDDVNMSEPTEVTTTSEVDKDSNENSVEVNGAAAPTSASTENKDSMAVSGEASVAVPKKPTGDGSAETKAETAGEGSIEIYDATKLKILKQIEYYFGDFNFPRDSFLVEEVKKDDGWITMEKMYNFKRLAQITTDNKVIYDALKTSKLIEVDSVGNKIRRSTDCPLPQYVDAENMREETIKRTVYVKGFPKDGSINLDVLFEFLKPFRPFESVYKRDFTDKVTKNRGFKGSILITFPSVEQAKTFMKPDDIKYKTIPLLRQWHADYLADKKGEIEERILRKEIRSRNLAKQKEEAEQIESIPTGAFLYMSGIPLTISREEVRANIMELIPNLCFVGYMKGDGKGYIRLAEEGSNVAALKELEGKFKLDDTAITLRLVEGEEEQNQRTMAFEARKNSYIFVGSKKRKERSGSKGSKGGRYPHSKRRKVN